jgi:conjugative transfer region protein (TIGR03750 family)
MESFANPDTTDAAAPARSPSAPLTDRVNVEPPILRGMTQSEATVVGLAALAVWVAVGAVLALVVGLWQVLPVAAVFGPLITLWRASSVLARLKRNRPDGYYRQALAMDLAARGLARQRFIRHAGYWSLGRALPFSLQPPKASSRVGRGEASRPDPHLHVEGRA